MILSVQKEFNRLRNLKQNRNKSEEELKYLEKEASINIAKKAIRVDDKFSDSKEKKIAMKQFEFYVGNYNFEKYSDLQTLTNLIYEEILLKRVQNHINKLYAEKEDIYLNKTDREALHSIEERIQDFKLRLGIDQEDKEKDELTDLQLLKKRFHQHIQQNKSDFTIACANCGKMLLLRKKVKDHECTLHPWFHSRWYFNFEILKDYKNGKITAKQASRYLDTSIDYVEWCIENWEKILEYK